MPSDGKRSSFEHVNFTKSLFNMQLEQVFRANFYKNMLFKNQRVKWSKFFKETGEKTCRELTNGVFAPSRRCASEW